MLLLHAVLAVLMRFQCLICQRVWLPERPFARLLHGLAVGLEVAAQAAGGQFCDLHVASLLLSQLPWALLAPKQPLHRQASGADTHLVGGIADPVWEAESSKHIWRQTFASCDGNDIWQSDSRTVALHLHPRRWNELVFARSGPESLNNRTFCIDSSWSPRLHPRGLLQSLFHKTGPVLSLLPVLAFSVLRLLY